MKTAKGRGLDDGGSAIRWFSMKYETDPLRSGRLGSANFVKFINDGQKRLYFEWRSSESSKMLW